MKSRFSMFLLLISTSIFAQFEAIEEGGKKGIKYQGELVYKAKLNDVWFLDDSIATALFKSKIYFINTEGKVIYKAKNGTAEKFSQGSAILIKTSKSGLTYGAINRDGQKIIPVKYRYKPEKTGNMLITLSYAGSSTIESYSDFNLFARNGLVVYGASEIKSRDQWVVAYDKLIEDVPVEKKKSNGKIKIIYEDKWDAQYLIFHRSSGKKLTDNVKKYRLEHEHLVAKRKDATLVVYKDSNEVLSGVLQEVIFNNTTIYALKDTMNAQNNLIIYNYEGEVLKEGLGFVSQFDEKRYVFFKDGNQFIGNEVGAQLSPYVRSFGSSSEGMVVVLLGNRYSYMNTETYEVMDASFPIIARKKTNSHGDYNVVRHAGTKLKNLGKRIGNFGRRFTTGKKKKLETYTWSSWTSESVDLVEDGRPFSEGYATVNVFGMDYTAAVDSLLVLEGGEELLYRIIDKSGNFINDKTYKQCFIFNNGKCWVRDNGWTLIDTTGKEVEGYHFEGVVPQENGYFVVNNGSFDFGLIGPNHDIILPCDQRRFEINDREVREKYGDKKLLYTLPQK